ncbi:MAG: hypothetical protein IPO28_12895 [Holophagaceae bacterium]|nr:hypothetical protein [Holophagaceae bacterium]
MPLLALWFWAIPQAFNLIDGLNGLSMGFSLIVITVLAAVLGHAPAGGLSDGGPGRAAAQLPLGASFPGRLRQPDAGHPSRGAFREGSR